MLRVVSGAQHFSIAFAKSNEGMDLTRKHAEVFYKHRLLFRIQRWAEAFDDLLSRPSMTKIRTKDRRAIYLLRVQYNLLWIAISNDKNNDETSFDNYLSNFEAIVNLAESAIDTECATSWTNWWANVNFQMQNIPPLYLTATKCRNPIIRRKALALLKGLFSGDRLWNLDIMIRLAERALQLEEEGLEDVTDSNGDVVPSEWARIHEVKSVPATINGHRMEFVTFKRRTNVNGNHW
jgi:hypothetical protein